MASSKKPNTVEICTKLAEPVAKELGLFFWDVRFEKEGSIWFLRYFMEKDGGIGIQDCEDFSRRMSKILDEADPIEQSYYLEVSSPGVERELSKPWHFAMYEGKKITVKLIRPKDGVREFTGALLHYEAKEESMTAVTLSVSETEERTFTWPEIAYVRLFDDFDYANAKLPNE